jgi:tungstate transport system substrate-binding protein
MNRLLVILLAVALVAPSRVPAESTWITLASTTSTRDSGLLDHLLPHFRAKTGIGVRVVAFGTGQAIRLARSGDADVLLVHDREAEELFVAEGWGTERRDVMHNDFVIVGPTPDPAGIRGSPRAADALARVRATKAPFLSRGDESGTHKAELRLWAAAGVDPTPESGSWYRETGAGMGTTLNTAWAMPAYKLVDRGTWLNYGNRGGFEILVEGDPALFNPYSVIPVNPDRHPHVKAREVTRFVEWLTSPEGQAAIGSFRVEGQPLFFPHSPPDRSP